ncbi:MAG TPA: Gfo/Idh/MocA family oxidoreductase [Chitinophagaceae bacterium]|nr:Gfo/Idh/MocA family oxidoreductase [Chitinophagaceae bacterium]
MNRQVISNQYSRRKFIHDLSVNAGIAALAVNGLNLFSSCGDSNEKNKGSAMTKNNQNKLGIALVGLGNYAGGQLAPALQQTNDCYLAGIVTGTPSKIETWKSKYSIPDKNIYNYQNFDTIKDNPDIDIVYVVLPNSMHAEYVIRAARAGKHVICEKPMAITTEDCDRMIAACNEAGKMLSIGYRLHFEPYNLEMARLGTKKIYGNLKKMNAGFGFPIGDPTQWRLNKKLAGGGPLEDVGIYCIQGFCYTTGLEPIAVTAQEGPKTDKEKFRDVEQSLTWELEFPGNILCQGKASYSEGLNYLHAEAEKGVFELTSAFNYSGQKGNTPAGPMDLPKVNQQARQMDDFAQAVKNKRSTPVPGEMGKRDVKIIQAIYKAMETGKRVEIK